MEIHNPELSLRAQSEITTANDNMAFGGCFYIIPGELRPAAVGVVCNYHRMLVNPPHMLRLSGMIGGTLIGQSYHISSLTIFNIHTYHAYLYLLPF